MEMVDSACRDPNEQLNLLEVKNKVEDHNVFMVHR